LVLEVTSRLKAIKEEYVPLSDRGCSTSHVVMNAHEFPA